MHRHKDFSSSTQTLRNIAAFFDSLMSRIGNRLQNIEAEISMMGRGRHLCSVMQCLLILVSAEAMHHLQASGLNS